MLHCTPALSASFATILCVNLPLLHCIPALSASFATILCVNLSLSTYSFCLEALMTSPIFLKYDSFIKLALRGDMSVLIFAGIQGVFQILDLFFSTSRLINWLTDF